jgi:agmatine deiminase
MITDNETDFVYLSNCLSELYPKFFSQFSEVLKDCDIDFSFLQNTKDVWIVDYMPIQITKDKFVQFVYNPDYLQRKKWLKSISNTDSICEALEINPIKSKIILDGGNVVRWRDKVILCDKVFSENPGTSKKLLIRELEELFEVEKLIFIPQHPNDFTGHADGLIRFYDGNTVVINDLKNEKDQFKRAFYIALHNADLEYIEIPYNPYNNQKHSQANGIYINYLQMKDVIIIPTFGMVEDDLVVKQFEQLFRGQKVATVDSNEIADKGGILNCITWNIVI